MVIQNIAIRGIFQKIRRRTEILSGWIESYGGKNYEGQGTNIHV